jgi:hypothetical protein
MEFPYFERFACAYRGAIYAGQWRSSPYSVTVRYKLREVSVTYGGPNKKTAATKLLQQIIETEQQLRAGVLSYA